MNVELCTEPTVWDEIIYDLAGHPLQLWGWGELKAAHNWKAYRLIVTNERKEVIGTAQILTRPLPAPFSRMSYIPRGPATVHDRDLVPVLDAISTYVKKHLGGTVLTVEPDRIEWPSSAKGWVKSPNTILIPRTLILDLNKSEEELLSDMAKKTRQYIRKSEREGVTITRLRTREEITSCLRIYRETAARAGFALHSDDYYIDLHEMMGESSVVFAATENNHLVAFLWLAVSSQTAFELYGGMTDRGQSTRANYTLKWHAIRRCKEWGITRYDMNGLLNDGVSTFKMSFASHEDMLVGTYDYPLSPLYGTWSKSLPAAKKIVRRLKSLRKP